MPETYDDMVELKPVPDRNCTGSSYLVLPTRICGDNMLQSCIPY